MLAKIVSVTLLLSHTVITQNADCDFYQNVAAGQSFYIYNPNYPANYTTGKTCRWITDCPVGYNCRLNCQEINMPNTPQCNGDRLLVSKTGDPSLASAERYCGRGSLNVVTSGQRLSVGLISISGSGWFRCQVSTVVATTPSVCSCGVRRQNRIVGGQETGMNEYTMMVGLADGRISQIKCGAVIISAKHVITAAHCVKGQSTSWLAVIVGEHNVTIGDSPATKGYRIASFTIHPNYVDSSFDYDIAIITVEGVIEFNDRVGPVCLPFKFVNTNFTGAKFTMLGWGTLFPGGPTSNVLRKVDVDVISQAACRTKMPVVTDRQMCTYTLGKDACQDDSGGPLLYTDPSTGLLFNLGIVSFGRFCASEDPGVNTRITALLNWILANTNVNYCIK